MALDPLGQELVEFFDLSLLFHQLLLTDVLHLPQRLLPLEYFVTQCASEVELFLTVEGAFLLEEGPVLEEGFFELIPAEALEGEVLS